MVAAIDVVPCIPLTGCYCGMFACALERRREKGKLKGKGGVSMGQRAGSCYYPICCNDCTLQEAVHIVNNDRTGKKCMESVLPCRQLDKI